MMCKNCIYYECGDFEVGLDEGCTHDSLYDESDNLIPEKVAMVERYMSEQQCPLKEQANER